MQTMMLSDPLYQCIQSGGIAIRRPDLVNLFSRDGMLKFRIYHVPSFTDCTSWNVYQEDDRLELQMIIWRQSKDRERLTDVLVKPSPIPTFEEFIFPLDAGWVKEQLKELADIPIPLNVSGPMGLDGESFGVHVPDRLDVEWWCDGPDEWSELISWAQKCISHFQEVEMLKRRQST
ncbi:MAG: hypothetical protein U0984_02185 [Prosthecobacter sp.]|nr:hypothetical protein [Prosthecobacter sp.]